jgi:hypothetical protein
MNLAVLKIISAQAHISTVRGYNFSGKKRLMSYIAKKGAPYVRSCRRNLFARVRPHRWRGPARLEHQFRRVKQYGCRNKIMTNDTHFIP